MKVATVAARWSFGSIQRCFIVVYRALPGPTWRRRARRCVAVVQRSFTRTELVTQQRWGRTLGGPLAEAPVLVLTTTGRRTGERRSTPLVYVEDGDDLLVVAAYGGLPWHPAWYLNLRADPHATALVAGRTLQIEAETVTDDERDRLWPTMTTGIATLAKSETLARPREIPLVRLRPDADTSR